MWIKLRKFCLMNAFIVNKFFEFSTFFRFFYMYTNVSFYIRENSIGKREIAWDLLSFKVHQRKNYIKYSIRYTVLCQTLLFILYLIPNSSFSLSPPLSKCCCLLISVLYKSILLRRNSPDGLIHFHIPYWKNENLYTRGCFY